MHIQISNNCTNSNININIVSPTVAERKPTPDLSKNVEQVISIPIPPPLPKKPEAPRLTLLKLPSDVQWSLVFSSFPDDEQTKIVTFS